MAFESWSKLSRMAVSEKNNEILLSQDGIFIANSEKRDKTNKEKKI